MKAVQRVVLVLIGLYHVGFALVAFFSQATAIWIAKLGFGVTLDGGIQVMYVAKVLGIYGLGFGLVCLVAAADPAKHRKLVFVILGVYALRIIERAVFLPAVKESFAISPARIAIGCVLLGAFAVALLVTTLGSRETT